MNNIIALTFNVKYLGIRASNPNSAVIHPRTAIPFQFFRTSLSYWQRSPPCYSLVARQTSSNHYCPVSLNDQRSSVINRLLPLHRRGRRNYETPIWRSPRNHPLALFASPLHHLYELVNLSLISFARFNGPRGGLSHSK